MQTAIERAESVIDRYKKRVDAPGQRDLLTGETRKTEKTQGKLRWITLHAHSGDATTHVQISDDGKIHAGPASLTGRNLNSLKGKTHHESRMHDPHLQYTSDGRPVGPTVRHIDKLHADPERFQFKVSGIDKATGTTSELKDVKEYNPELGGQLLVWHDPEDGRDYVINGHHRFRLAKQSPKNDEVGKFNGNVPVYYVNAKTHKEARAHGALANIAEGRGSGLDAAKFMRDMGVGLEEFEKHGISPKGHIAQMALDLKNLSPTIFQKLTNGSISEGRAAAIGKHLASEDAQDQLFGWIQKHEKEKAPFSDRKVAEMARSTAAMKPKTSGGGMFDDFFDQFPIAERADIAEHIGRTLSGELKSLKDASSERRAGVIEAEGENKIDTATNRSRAQRAAIHEDEFSKRANAQGHPIAMSLDSYAERLANEPKSKRSSILKESLAEIRRLIDSKSGPKEGFVQPLQGTGEGGSGAEHGVRDTSGPVAKMSKRFDRAEANARYCREKYEGQRPFRGWFK